MTYCEVAVIDRISRAAQALAWLRTPALAAALGCLALVVALLLVSESREVDRYLIPGALGLLWSLSVYSFIGLFRAVPAKAPIGTGVFERLRRRLARALFWALAVVFICATAVAAFVTSRMVHVWLDEFLS